MIRRILVKAAAAAVVAFALAHPAEAAKPKRAAGEARPGLAATWARNCARCHPMRSPDTYSDAQWEVAIFHHTVRTWVSFRAGQDILKFLQAAN